ncbi:hypothetical protein WA026_014248 [Henosepilachna vigintioctopunctata]|uniref:3-oxoacid CoA-transferase n=1 Tax=Henosepilachna vigintioctopunctata TaxID=420089 RepID=A0AAW1TND2_9CUCU
MPKRTFNDMWIKCHQEHTLDGDLLFCTVYSKIEKPHPLLDDQNQNIKSSKIFKNAEEVLSDVKNESSLLLGGFGICGIPENLITGLLHMNIGNLTVISSHAGIDHFGLGALLAQHKIRKIIASSVGRNEEFQRQYLSGELEVELTPQGTLAEKIRAARAGIPAFFTPSGYGTLVQDGKVPVKYKTFGEVEFYSEPKRTEFFEGKPYILERAISADFALIKAWKADVYGNLVFHESARNFNSIMAAAAKITIVEAEHILNAGDINPNEIHTPGIYIDRIIQGKSYEKIIEKIVSPNEDKTKLREQNINPNVERIIKRAVLEFQDGMYGILLVVIKTRSCNTKNSTPN